MNLQWKVEIREDVEGAAYIEFFNYCFAVSSQGHFVVRNDVPASKSLETTLQRMGSCLTATDVEAWPGTILHGSLRAKLYTFPTSEPVRNLLFPLTNHLCGWAQPDMPEDLGFRDGQGRILAESTTHESYLAMHLDELRKAVLKERYPNLFRLCVSRASAC